MLEVKLGDMLVYTYPLAYNSPIRRLVEVEKVNAKTVKVRGDNRLFRIANGKSIPKGHGLLRMPEDGEVEFLQEEKRLKEEKAKRIQQEQAAYEAREDVKLARRLANLDHDDFLHIPVERLRQMVAWLDENRQAGKS
jgi:hypothetical protein